MGDGEDSEEEERTDRMAIASTSSSSPPQNPNLKPNKGLTLTHQHLSKFQELHTRRLQIKSKSKSKSKIRKNKKEKGATGKSQIKHGKSSGEVNEAGFSNSDVAFGENASLQKTTLPLPSKNLQKLHWGLDTKEPWERKANM